MTTDTDDDDTIFGNYVVPDGGSVRVRVDMMDNVRREVFDAANHRPGFRSSTDAAVQDARRIARDARNEYVQRLTSAWQTPSRDAAEPDASEELLRGHLQTERGESQRRRDAAWNAYKDQLSRAYLQGRTADPSAAGRIMRQSARWHGGMPAGGDGS